MRLKPSIKPSDTRRSPDQAPCFQSVLQHGQNHSFGPTGPKTHRKAAQDGLGLREEKGGQNTRDAPRPSYGQENHTLGGTHHSMERLAVLPRMENVGDEQGIRRDLIANFIIIHDEAPNLTG